MTRKLQGVAVASCWRQLLKRERCVELCAAVCAWMLSDLPLSSSFASSPRTFPFFFYTYLALLSAFIRIKAVKILWLWTLWLISCSWFWGPTSTFSFRVADIRNIGHLKEGANGRNVLSVTELAKNAHSIVKMHDDKKSFKCTCLVSFRMHCACNETFCAPCPHWNLMLLNVVLLLSLWACKCLGKASAMISRTKVLEVSYHGAYGSLCNQRQNRLHLRRCSCACRVSTGPLHVYLASSPWYSPSKLPWRTRVSHMALVFEMVNMWMVDFFLYVVCNQ